MSVHLICSFSMSGSTEVIACSFNSPQGDLIFVTKAEIAVIKRAIGHRAILDEGLYKTYINFQSLFDLF
jgi:hypothetical protein